MADFNLVPGSLNISGIVGNDFSMLLDFDIDLTGYTFEAQVILQNVPSNNYGIFTVDEVNLSEGRISLNLTDVQTRNIGPISKTKWFLSWSVGGNDRTILSGKFTLNQPWAPGDVPPTTEAVPISIDDTTVLITVIGGAGGSILWGDIQGDIENQADLITLLDGKEPVIPAGTINDYLRGDKTFQPVLNLPISSATQDAIDAQLPGPLYLFTNHLNSSSGGKLTYGLSVNGIAPTRIGSFPGYFPPDSPSGWVRDPTTMEWPATHEFITAYTAGATGVGNVIGLCKARDLNHPEFVTSIPITGITGTVTTVWVGTLHNIDGRVILTLLPFTSGSFDSPGIGWIECLNPGVWTEWSDFTSFKSTNPNLAGAWHFNDPQIVKVGSTYHMFMDGHSSVGGSDGVIMHATSSSFLTGYSVPTELAHNITTSIGESYEGAIIARNPTDDGWFLYFQTIFGPLYYSKGSDDFSTWTTPALVPWPEAITIGNGSVIRVTEPWAIKTILAADRPAIAPGDDQDGSHASKIFPCEFLAVYLKEILAADIYTNGGRVGFNWPGNAAIGTDGQFGEFRLKGGTQLQAVVNGGVVNYGNFNQSAWDFFGWSNETGAIATMGKDDGRLALGKSFNKAREMLDVGGNIIADGTIKGSNNPGYVNVPASASSAGTVGQYAFDSSFIYICIGTNTWMRAAIATW